jgi:imidazolonepropionase-like amidohydrolase
MRAVYRLLAGALAVAATPAIAQPSPTTFIQAGRLLADPATGRVLTDQTIVVQGGRVVAIRDGFVGAGEGEVVDLRDRFVLPGLIDAHVHICHENGPNDQLRRTVQSAADLAVDGAYYAQITLRAGFTTVADVGEENDAIFAVRDGIARGRSELASGLGQQFTDAEMRAIVESAHALGRRVTAHAHDATAINAFLRAGGDSIQHGTNLDAESVRLLRSNNAYLVPTLLAGETVTRWGNDPSSHLSAAVREKALLVGPRMLDSTRRAHQGGVRIAFGTDSSVSPHGRNAREFSLLVQAGLSPIEAVRTATVNAADHLGISGEAGTIAAGRPADIIAVAGDPLRDVAALEQVGFVMRGGRVYRRD